MEMSRHDQVLAGLVISLQTATMQHLGKIANVVTGKVERDLDQARGTIDILEMLKEKCRQGTPAEILALLDKAVMELQLNFLDEMKREQGADSEAAGEGAAAAGGSGEPEVGPETAQGSGESSDAGDSEAGEGGSGESAGDKES